MKKKNKINKEIVEIKEWINSWNLLEKIFIIVFCLYMIFLLVEAITNLNEQIFFFIPFVILSGGLTVRARTLIRAILFCIVTIIPILCTILTLAFDHNLNEYCKEVKKFLYDDCINVHQNNINNIGIKYNDYVDNNAKTYLAGLIILCIFQITFMIIVVLLWRMRYWKFLPEFTLTTRKNIKQMFTKYVCLISTIHLNIIIVGYWITINWYNNFVLSLQFISDLILL
ncbi:hypothetical protein C1645_876427 [Glomus cerebriforme]|uniref:Uncharacterized protein n=1 Tax=Glomus cerebriforme TaxID=658196 RepID=A0A397SZ23_9GLOM|nr:hypothetical protein C1645_876427 [Glomus cerebriforme]